MKIVEPDALLCSNTSTLPITELAAGVDRPGDFIGLHFFSPVDKMPLVEIIRGERTSDATLAKAFDVALGLRKTPIVVNDSRGFFTSRVIGTFLNEGVAMLAEGIDPQTIEQASAQAGYPAPVLQLMDELTLTLPRKIRQETRAAVEAAGGTWQPHPADAVIDRMVDEFDRPGRAGGAGFYSYSGGRRSGLWPGLRSEFGARNHDVDLAELSERMLVIEALETARCFDEGVLTSVPDANIGSILGIGFPAWTGGVVQYVEGFPGGVAGFVRRADELRAQHGPRFEVPASLRARASTAPPHPGARPHSPVAPQRESLRGGGLQGGFDQGLGAQVGAALVLRVADHVGERAAARVGDQQHRVPVLAGFGHQGRCPVAEVEHARPDPLGAGPEVGQVGVVPFRAVGGEAQQVEHDDGLVRVRGEERLQRRPGGVHGHDPYPR